MPFLSTPQAAHKNSFLEALREYQAEGRYRYWNADVLAADFDGFLRELDRRSRNLDPESERVPESRFWLIDDDRATYIGRVSIRHRLNEALERLGGHIGYDIRPSMRRRGYGTLMCKLALEEARTLGLERVMITCDEDNIGSRKIIEANGGILEGGQVVDRPGILCLRFWVDLRETNP